MGEPNGWAHSVMPQMAFHLAVLCTDCSHWWGFGTYIRFSPVALSSPFLTQSILTPEGLDTITPSTETRGDIVCFFFLLESKILLRVCVHRQSHSGKEKPITTKWEQQLWGCCIGFLPLHLWTQPAFMATVCLG